MKYEIVVETYQKLESTSSTLEKTDIIARVLSQTPPEYLKKVIYLIMGKVFPPWMQKELNVGEKLTIAAISRVTGASQNEILELVKKKGDLGSAAAVLVAKRKQVTLFQEELTVAKVFSTFQKIAEAEGEGSVDKKVALLSELLSNSKPEEAKYIVRTVMEELRIGVGEGIVRDAIAKAFNVPAELVERAYAVLNDYGEVAEIALKGVEELKKVKLRPGRPLKVMLYHKAENIEEAIEKVGKPAQVEFKYDGFRTQIHKIGDRIVIFTRRLEEVTSQFPEIVERALRCLRAEEVIVDSETVGFDPKTGKWLPFQRISQRIKRKYDIEKMVKEIPVETHVFDILYLNGENLIDRPLGERFEILKKILKEEERFKLVDYIRTGSIEEANAFYQKALNTGAEGIMVKNVNAPYKPGQRTGYGYKVKPLMETLDLVIVGAEWGEGKRAHWLSSYLLAARDPETGEFLPVGKAGTGMTEEDLENMTQLLKPLIKKEMGKEAELEPRVVVEVAFQEIQKSPNYRSGFALRFPRIVRVREDKAPEEADTVNRVRELYQQQFRRGGSQTAH